MVRLYVAACAERMASVSGIATGLWHARVTAGRERFRPGLLGRAVGDAA